LRLLSNELPNILSQTFFLLFGDACCTRYSACLYQGFDLYCCVWKQALADAIFAVTDMNPDLSVAKIEIQTKE